MKIALLISILFMTSAFADGFTKGQGHFWSREGDSYEFIKNQLRHEGFKSIISKELDQMELNKEVFWKKYDEKLAERYKDIEDTLAKQLKIDEKTSKKDKKEFKKRLRQKQLKFRLRYAKLENLILKHTIKKISRSQKNANLRTIRLEGAVDPNLLSKLYYRFVSGDKRSDYGSLYININYDLENITFSELGIENENEFSSVITDKWIDWFSKNKPMNIANIEILSADNKSRYDEYQKLPTEMMLGNIPEVFVNSLLLDIEVKIIRKKYDKRKKRYEFLYEGAGYLKDLQSNLILQTYNFNSEHKTYNNIKESTNLANIIVNHVYRMALGSFPNIVSSIKNVTNVSSVQKLTLTDFRNMKRVLDLIELIQNKGIKYSVKTHIENIGQNKADVFVYYDGKIADLKRMLMGLRSAKKDLSFAVIEENNQLSIKFNNEDSKNGIL